jgi:hypothetical protein
LTSCPAVEPEAGGGGFALEDGIVSNRPRATLKNGSALIDGRALTLPSHELIQVIGSGANGIVFKANNRTLNRVEAVKFWLPRKGDPRNKVKQGTLEAHDRLLRLIRK